MQRSFGMQSQDNYLADNAFKQNVNQNYYNFIYFCIDFDINQNLLTF